MSVPDPATTEWVPLYGPAGLPGPPDLNYKGAYAAGAYKEGDIVIYQGVAYLCVTDTSEAPTPWPVTGTPVPTPVVNGQWLKGAGGVPVWTPITVADVSGAVNGQFVKGSGGAAIWSALAAADVKGGTDGQYLRSTSGAGGWAQVVGADAGIAVFTANVGGAWPKTVGTITLARKSDVMLTMGCSMYATGGGVQGHVPQWDGADLPNFGDYYFNETSSHKQTVSNNVIRGAAAGSHTVAVRLSAGASDANDRCSFSAIAVAVP